MGEPIDVANLAARLTALEGLVADVLTGQGADGKPLMPVFRGYLVEVKEAVRDGCVIVSKASGRSYMSQGTLDSITAFEKALQNWVDCGDVNRYAKFGTCAPPTPPYVQVVGI